MVNKHFVWEWRICPPMFLLNYVRKFGSRQYINIALLLKGNVELQDICSGGILHITDKGQKLGPKSPETKSIT